MLPGVTWEGFLTEAAAVEWLGALHRVRLQVSQQLHLRAECLRADGAGEVEHAVLQPVGVSLFGRLKHLVALAAGKPAPVQVGLLVIGQAGQVVERLLTLAALVHGAGPVAPLVR